MIAGTYVSYEQEARSIAFDEDSDPVGIPFVSSDEPILREIRNNVKKARDHLNNWFEDSRQAYDFYANHQWQDEDIQKLRQEKRPAITFNRIPRVINAICGIELENRQEVIYMPRENGDAIASEVLTGAAHWVREQCDAEDEESSAFKDALICGVGWVETTLDYEVDPDGAILIQRVDPLEMVWDTAARKRNLSDAKWIARQKTYTKQEFKALWPDAPVDTLGYSEHNKGIQPHDRMIAPWYIVDQSANDQRPRNKIEVIQYQKWVREKFYRVQMENDIVEMDEEDFNKWKKVINARGLKYVQQTRKVWKQWFIAGEHILEHGDCPVNNFTFKAITGMLDRNHNTWFGMINIMRDPQMWANKWLSQTLHIFNTNAKGGWFVEDGAFKDPRQAERTLATSSVTYLNEGALAEGKLKEKTAPGFPPQINELLSLAMSSTSDLVGVNLESLGQVNRMQAGVLEVERKKSTITILADFFDGLRRYRKEQGRILADFIVSYISDGRLVRIAGPGLGKYVPLVADQLNFTYDIIVDDVPTSPHQKERVFATLTQLLPNLLQAGIPIPPEILEYAPLPPSLIRDWQEAINNQQPDQMEQMKEQIRLALAEQELKNKQADEVEKKTQAALNLAKFEHERALADHDIAMADLDMGLKIANSLA